MKGEYINLFTALANPITKEVIIVLKQETPNPYFETDENGNKQINTTIESIDMYKAILSVENAKQLVGILSMCIEQAEKQQEIAKND